MSDFFFSCVAVRKAVVYSVTACSLEFHYLFDVSECAGRRRR